MTEAVMDVREVLKKIHDSAKKSTGRKQLDARQMPVGEVVRQGDVYVVKVGTYDDFIVKMDAHFGMLDGQYLERIQTRKNSVETWAGSRHIVEAPDRIEFTGDLGEDSDVIITTTKVTARKHAAKLVVTMYAALRQNFRDLNLPDTPTMLVVSPRDWRLLHHEHGDYDLSNGIFAITRQMDLQTQRYTVD